MLASQFTDFMIVVLIAAAAISAVIGDRSRRVDRDVAARIGLRSDA
jgi:hypothetical protein